MDVFLVCPEQLTGPTVFPCLVGVNSPSREGGDTAGSIAADDRRRRLALRHRVEAARQHVGGSLPIAKTELFDHMQALDSFMALECELNERMFFGLWPSCRI